VNPTTAVRQALAAAGLHHPVQVIRTTRDRTRTVVTIGSGTVVGPHTTLVCGPAHWAALITPILAAMDGATAVTHTPFAPLAAPRIRLTITWRDR